MPQLYAPDFMKKLQLLLRHAKFGSIAEIASEMGVKEHTLRSWTKDHGVRPEGTIAKNGRKLVIKLYCGHLTHLSEQKVIELLEGPYDDMAIAFFTQSFSGLATFIEREATFDGAKLYIDHNDASEAAEKGRLMRERQRADADDADNRDILRRGGMVTIKTRPRIVPSKFVPIGTDFRLEFPSAHRAKYYLGLQQTSQGWAAIPASPMTQDKIVHMPAADEGGDPVMMCEYHDHGPSRFTLVQAMQPFPDFVHTNLCDGIPLSRTDIGFLTRHLQDLSKADRALTAIDIAFFAEQQS